MRTVAQWNRARDVWETESIDLFSEHSDVFLETWPTSGTTRNGEAYEQPTLVPRMADTASSLLPTPNAGHGDPRGSQPPEKRRAGGHQPSVADVIEHL